MEMKEIILMKMMVDDSDSEDAQIQIDVVEILALTV